MKTLLTGFLRSSVSGSKLRGLTACLSLLLLSGCSLTDENGEVMVGNGIRLSSVRTVGSSISKVAVDNTYDLIINTGRNTRVTVKADQNLLEHIGVTTPGGGQVVIANSKELLPTSDILVDIDLPNLAATHLRFESEARALAVSESAMSVILEHGSRLELSGFVETLTVDMSGSARLEAPGLKVGTLDLKASGTASAGVGQITSLSVILEDTSRLDVSSNATFLTSSVADNARLNLAE